MDQIIAGCDTAACPAAAVVVVAKALTGTTPTTWVELHFCAHHYADIQAVLTAKGWRLIVDRRDELAAKP